MLLHFNNILWKHASNNDTAREEKQPNFYNIPTKRERERERHQKKKTKDIFDFN